MSILTFTPRAFAPKDVILVCRESFPHLSHSLSLSHRNEVVVKLTQSLSFVAAYFLWKLENPKPMQERRFFKRYLTFWHLYNLFADIFFLIGLLMKLVEWLIMNDEP